MIEWPLEYFLILLIWIIPLSIIIYVLDKENKEYFKYVEKCEKEEFEFYKKQKGAKAGGK